VLNAAEIRKAIYSLRVNNVPGFQANMYKALIHPAGHFDLQSDTAAGSWLETSKYIKNDEIMRGEVGALYGTRFVVSTNAGSGTGATDETFHAYVFGRDAYAVSELSGQGMEMIRKEPGPQDTSNPLNMFSTVGWKFVLAAKVLQSVRAVQIYAGSAAE
jgi:N4-gp56 family major capsid protein